MVALSRNILSSFLFKAHRGYISSCWPKLPHPREKNWHSLDLRRGLHLYVRRTKPFRRLDSLFAAFHPAVKGVSKATLSRWLKGCTPWKMNHRTFWDQRGSQLIRQEVFLYQQHSTQIHPLQISARSLLGTTRWTPPLQVMQHFGGKSDHEWSSPIVKVRRRALDPF